jgi:hypothetical protein
MTETLNTVIVDGLTGETVERVMTTKEIADLETAQSEAESQDAEAQAKAAARESALAKLAELGLNAEEIAAL